MIYFDLGDNLTPKILDIINNADEYIRIAIFQIHKDEVFEKLKHKVNEGVRVEILTLPYDSINEDIREDVTSKLRDLANNGVVFHFCKWNVGDPERTTTAVGRWYSFHGKFIVTDNSAVALSANLTRNDEVDAILVYDNDIDMIKQYNDKFDYLIDLFVSEINGGYGRLRKNVLDIDDTYRELFNLPRIIETATHESTWIQHYPLSICDNNSELNDGLFIAPFDYRALSLYEKIIKSAESYVYISAESFTEDDFADTLVKVKESGVDIRLLSGRTTMDYRDRRELMIKRLLANDIGFKTTTQPIHAKLLITESYLVVSSVNLNKMGLGFHKGSNFWRSNTETIAVCTNHDVVQSATQKYLDLYDGSAIDIKDVLAERLMGTIRHLFSSQYGLRTRREAKIIFAKYILNRQINVERMVYHVGRITKRIAELRHVVTVTKIEILSALILYFLSERKHAYHELETKLLELDDDIEINTYLELLQTNDLITFEDDYYKINLHRVIE